jgi:hypothetical protein
VVLKVKNPLALIGVIVGQSGVTRVKPSKSGNSETFRNILLVIWSLLISTSISFVYNGLLTADMLVPVPDKVIETFKQLILSGFKIAYHSNLPVTYWFGVSKIIKFKIKYMYSNLATNVSFFCSKLPISLLFPYFFVVFFSTEQFHPFWSPISVKQLIHP